MRSTCPICSSNDVTVNWTCSVGQAAEQWASSKHEPVRHAELTGIIADIWQRDEVMSCRCNACGFGFADPFVAGDGKFYSVAFGESGYPSDKWEMRRTIQAIKNYDYKNWDVLDIGTGAGFFLNMIEGIGIPTQNCYATEYNEVTIGRLRERGFVVEPFDLGELKKFGRSFDAVFMFQVLEHRDKIHHLFHEIHEILKYNGRLFIAVPSGLRIYFNERNGSLLDMPPNHISRWMPENLRAIGEKFGFDVVNSDVEPFNLARFLKQDLIFSFMRKAQTVGSLANYLYAKRKSKIGRVAVAAAIGVNGITRVPTWITKQKELRELGENIWVEFVKRA